MDYSLTSDIRNILYPTHIYLSYSTPAQTSPTLQTK